MEIVRQRAAQVRPGSYKKVFEHYWRQPQLTKVSIWVNAEFIDPYDLYTMMKPIGRPWRDNYNSYFNSFAVWSGWTWRVWVVWFICKRQLSMQKKKKKNHYFEELFFLSLLFKIFTIWDLTHYEHFAFMCDEVNRYHSLPHFNVFYSDFKLKLNLKGGGGHANKFSNSNPFQFDKSGT
jgi:hypothetical protein